MNRKYYQISTIERVAEINIYGNITSYPWEELGEVSAKNIKQEIDELDVDSINVYINSYGGEVAEALAIYSALSRHKAKVHTYCDGFACSAATIIFAAGDERTMGSIALMMIHNCMSYVGYANSNELRKAADDNDKINQSSIEAYKKISNLSEEQIKDMMNQETWLTAQECLEYGFATDIAQDEEDRTAQQSAFALVRDAVMNRGSFERTIQEEMNLKLDAIMEMLQEKEGDPDNLDVPEQTEEVNMKRQKASDFFAYITGKGEEDA